MEIETGHIYQVVRCPPKHVEKGLTFLDPGRMVSEAMRAVRAQEQICHDKKLRAVESLSSKTSTKASFLPMDKIEKRVETFLGRIIEMYRKSPQMPRKT